MASRTTGVTAEDMQAALDSILRDDRLAHAGRLREFLSYIVAEEMAGRGDAILGKTIAQDVYGRGPEHGSDPENVVRVDARRLRQMLELHYTDAGKDDPVRLHLDSGGYRPRFEQVAARSAKGRRHAPVLAVATFAGGAVIGAVLAATLLPDAEPEQAASAPPDPARLDATELLRRAAIYDKSPASLQAFNLAEQARGMIFPIFDRPRQEFVLSGFQRVIELDPDYHGGYAGAAQALATLAILTLPGTDAPDYAEAARQMAEEAVRLAPDEAWSQSALSWAQLAGGDYDEATRLGRRAARLDPTDGHTLDFLGAVALFAGAFEEAVELSERPLYKASSNQRFANRNIAGAAHFHLGNYVLTAERFEEAAEFGDPLSAASLAYHTAALAALGRERAARAKLAELQAAWPDAPVDRALLRIYRDASHPAEVVSELRRLGWTAAE